MRRGKAEILALWEDRVRAALPAANGLDTHALIDSLPDFLDELIFALQRPLEESAVLQREKAMGEAHGRQRTNFDEYSLEQVLREYNVLRDVIFDVLERDGELTRQEMHTVYCALQTGVQNCALEFAAFRQERADAERAEAIETTASLNALLASASIGIGFLDRKLRYFRVNSTLAAINGFSPEEHIGRTVGEMLPDLAGVLEPVLRRVIDEGQPVLNFETSRIPKMDPSRVHHYLSSYFPMRSDRGDVIGLGGALVDITELKESIMQAREEREMRERFVAALSHDLRTPLTAVKALAQLVLRYPERTESHAPMLARVVDNVERADRMIQDLLDAHRVRAGERIQLQLGDCDLAAIARQTLEEFTLIHGDRFVLRERGEVRGHWSCDGLHRVLDNLVSNAVKYGSPNTPITIELRNLGAAGAEFSVHNVGGEMTDKEQKEVFKHYRRLRAAAESDLKGWGIGLTLVRGIVEAHGGKVNVESGQGEGTRMVVTLPWDSRR